jgi:hypothetical protein
MWLHRSINPQQQIPFQQQVLLTCNKWCLLHNHYNLLVAMHALDQQNAPATQSGLITACLACCPRHVANASGVSWNQGALDFTGAQMVLTLKLISTAMCYQDYNSKTPQVCAVRASAGAAAAASLC